MNLIGRALICLIEAINEKSLMVDLAAYLPYYLMRKKRKHVKLTFVIKTSH